MEGGELLERHLPRLGRHPGKLLDVRRIGGAQVLDQRQRLLPGSGREVTLHIELAHGLAQILVQRVHRTLPAVFLGLLTAQRALVEVEALLIEGLGQHLGVVGQVVVPEVGAPVVHRYLEEELREVLHRIQLAHHELLLRVHTFTREQQVPAEARRELIELGEGAGVPGEIALATLRRRPVKLGDAGLDLEYGVRLAGGVMIAGEREQTRDVREVLRAQVGVDRVPLEVVVAVRQAEAALGDRDRVAVGILLVEVDPDAQRRLEREVRAAHEPRQLLVGAGVADGVECRLRGGEAEALDRFRIQVAAVIVADLLPVACGRRAVGERLDDRAHLIVRALAELVEGAPAGAIGWNLMGVEPVPVGVTVEVIARLHAAVTGRKVQSPGGDLRGGRGRRWRRRRARRRLRAAHRSQHRDAEETRAKAFRHVRHSLNRSCHTPDANSTQPMIHASPPSGVSTPSARGAPRASAYRLPGKSTIPATISAAAARSIPVSRPRSVSPMPSNPRAWRKW